MPEAKSVDIQPGQVEEPASLIREARSRAWRDLPRSLARVGLASLVAVLFFANMLWSLNALTLEIISLMFSVSFGAILLFSAIPFAVRKNTLAWNEKAVRWNGSSFVWEKITGYRVVPIRQGLVHFAIYHRAIHWEHPMVLGLQLSESDGRRAADIFALRVPSMSAGGYTVPDGSAILHPIDTLKLGFTYLLMLFLACTLFSVLLSQVFIRSSLPVPWGIFGGGVLVAGLCVVALLSTGKSIKSIFWDSRGIYFGHPFFTISWQDLESWETTPFPARKNYKALVLHIRRAWIFTLQVRVAIPEPGMIELSDALKIYCPHRGATEI